MYAIQATVETKGSGGYRGVKQIPTFYLDERVQGIMSEKHAKAIALDILRAAVPNLIAVKFNVTAVRVSDSEAV